MAEFDKTNGKWRNVERVVHIVLKSKEALKDARYYWCD